MFVESLVEGRKQFQYAVIIVGRAFVGFAVSQLADIVRPVSDYIFVFEPVVIFVSFHESEVGVYRQHLFPERHLGGERTLQAVVLGRFFAAVYQLGHGDTGGIVCPGSVRVLVPVGGSQVVEDAHVRVAVPFLADAVAVDIRFAAAGKITRFDAVGGDKRSVVRERQPVPYFITDLGPHTVAAVVVILYDTGQDTVLIVHTAGKVELRFLGGAGDR